MVFGLFRKRPWEEASYALYGAVVRQARQPVFYTSLGVEDTVDGRFDMVILHATLVIRRLQQLGEDGPALSQALFDLMFADMDRNLREMGVGDMSVGKHVKAMAKAFYGRAAAYEPGLAGGDLPGLMDSLQRNLYRKMTPGAGQLEQMAAYVMAQAAALGQVPFEDFVAGTVPFVNPAESAAITGSGQQVDAQGQE